MYHWRFISFNKHTTLQEDVDNRGSYASMGAGVIKEISEPSAQFYNEPKIVLKIVYFKKVKLLELPSPKYLLP